MFSVIMEKNLIDKHSKKIAYVLKKIGNVMLVFTERIMDHAYQMIINLKILVHQKFVREVIL